MLMRAMTSLLMITVGLTGCLDRFEAPAQGTPASPDANDPNDPDPNDPDPNDPDPNDPNDPNDPLASRTWCEPAAFEATPGLQLPEVPAEALDRTCSLETQTTFYSWNSGEQVTRYSWVDDTLWVEYGSDATWNLLKVVFDAASHRSEVVFGRQKGSGGFTFAAYEDAYRFRYDGAGRLTEYAVLRGNLEHIYLTQRWVDGALVERLEERNYYGDGASEPTALPLRSTWRYEDGRLAGASATFRDSSWTVDWFYDGQGRPILVERKRDGIMYGRMTWSFDGQNRLARRTVLRDPSIENPDGYGPGPLDTLGVNSDNIWNGDPWANSVPRFSDAGCLILPTSDEYGYPGDAVEYELGTPRGERPNGMGFAYGANTYGWDYGDLAWYSHAGVHGLESQYRGSSQLQSDTRYVAGRMVEETVSSPAGPLTATRRTRSFEDGNLVIDRMELTVSPEVYPDAEGHTPERTSHTYGRELQFTWRTAGGQPALLQRDLNDDEGGLLEWQTWTRDLEGRWLSHSLFGLDRWGSRAAIPMWNGEYDPCTEGCPEDEVTLRVVYARSLDGAGRTVERSVARPDGDGVLNQEQVETWRFDDAGRLVEQRTNASYLQRWEYDAAGRLVREVYDYDGEGEPDGWTATTYDEAGRWIEQATWSGGTLHNSVKRAFACE